MNGDEIVLTLPADDDFRRVAHLVLGGLAARIDLTYEHLEDLKLALDGLLERRGDDGDITLAVRLEEDALAASVGPFSPEMLHELQEDQPFGLRRILATVCDGFELSERNDGSWVELRKSYERAEGAPA
jgi:anti-sigma regulatory factor (Ser/Thr protein kinase)